jgi:hypothetical protein
MVYFNKKEEVIHFKPTPYGRYLISLGKFKPKYYAFFDNNVLYAPEYGDFEQKQNNIEERVQENTPYTKGQHSFTSVEKGINQSNRMCKNGEIVYKPMQHEADRLYSLSAPLGNMDISSVHAPAWQVIFLRSELSSSTKTLTGSFPTQKIPQLNIKVPYHIVIRDEDSPPKLEIGSYYQESSTFVDGTSIGVEATYLLLDVVENNSEFLNENFNIEVFRIEREETSGSAYTPGLKDPRSRTRLIPLSFVKRPEYIVDGILLDSDEVKLVSPSFVPDNTYVEHYFDLKVDYGIPKSDLCQSIETLERLENVFIDIGFDPAVDCPESTLKMGNFRGTYLTDSTDEDGC